MAHLYAKNNKLIKIYIIILTYNHIKMPKILINLGNVGL